MMPIFPLVVDISHEDDDPNFEKAYAYGVRGIIHKASQGVSFKDPKYLERKKAAQTAGMLWGAYHFASGEDVLKQVDCFMLTIGDYTDTICVLDYEPNHQTSTMTIDQARLWMQRIDQLTGRPCMIYSGSLIKETLPRPDPFFAAHRLWLAEYGPTAFVPSSWPYPYLWQYSGDGIGPTPNLVPGFVGHQDVSTFCGQVDQLATSWLW